MTETKNVGLIKLKSAIDLGGPDTPRFLNGMLTNDLKKAFAHAPSCGRAFLLTNKAKIISEIFFFCRTSTTITLFLPAEEGENVFNALAKYLIADEVTVSSPRPCEVLVLTESEFNLDPVSPTHPEGQEKIYRAQPNFLPVGLLSTSHVEVPLGEMPMVPHEKISGDDLWELYWRAGQPHWGVDLLKDDFFLEFPLADSVSFDKGCYIGQEVVARGTFRGKVNKGYAHLEGNLTGPLDDHIGTIRSMQGNRATGIVKFSAGLSTELKISILVNDRTYRGQR